MVKCQSSRRYRHVAGATAVKGSHYTNVLVRNNLNALDVTSGLEDLAQDVLGDSRVQATHIQSSFVRLGSRTTRDIPSAAAGGRHDVCAHGRADGRRDGIRVLRDDDGRQRRGRHVLLGLARSTPIVARGACGGRRRRHLSLRGGRVGHGDYATRTERMKRKKAEATEDGVRVGASAVYGEGDTNVYEGQDRRRWMCGGGGGATRVF